MIIDWHIHFTPEEFIKPKLGPGGTSTIKFVDGKPGGSASALRCDLDRFIEAMDHAGVDTAVLSSGDAMRGDLDTCRLVNDRLKAAEEKYPGRFVGMAHTPPLGGAEAFAELKRCKEELGFKGAAMHTTVLGKDVDDPELWPFYERVREMGMFLFLHPGSAVYERYLDYDLGRSVGREGHLMTVVVRIINGGILDDFPGLKIVMSHLGGGFAFWMSRILSYQNKEFWLTKDHPRHGKLAKRPFREYLDEMLFDTGGITGYINPVKMTLMELSPKTILFGTDFPIEIREGETIRRFIADIRKLPLAQEEIDGILANNGRALIGV